LLEITEQAGATLPCGAVIGYWDDGRAGDARSPDAEGAAVPRAPEETAASPTAPAAPAATAAAGACVSRIPVTPLARRLAAQHGVDLTGIAGSGPRGRVRARDVLDAADARPAIIATQDNAVPPS